MFFKIKATYLYKLHEVQSVYVQNKRNKLHLFMGCFYLIHNTSSIVNKFNYYLSFETNEICILKNY